MNYFDLTLAGFSYYELTTNLCFWCYWWRAQEGTQWHVQKIIYSHTPHGPTIGNYL